MRGTGGHYLTGLYNGGTVYAIRGRVYLSSVKHQGAVLFRKNAARFL